MPEPIRKTQARAAQREQQRKKQETRERLRGMLPFVLVGILALAGALLIAYGALAGSPDIQGKNGPRLAVDQDSIDIGDQHFDTTVRATVTLTNKGDGTLKLDVPKLATAVEGC